MLPSSAELFREFCDINNNINGGYSSSNILSSIPMHIWNNVAVGKSKWVHKPEEICLLQPYPLS